ncbi:phosphoethanolamine transferase [Psychromonas sp. KJ10-10]|uniref:phosphoethanolamine transferase n=1 Tax=Psychromonas sp. KJ10-10 TaxID=3391823 RepID=UPI0039B50F70
MKTYQKLFLTVNRLSPETIISLLAVYFASVLNLPFSQRIYQLAGDSHFLFSLTPTLLLTACFVIIFSLIYSFVSGRIFKPFMIFLLITSASAMYASLQYQIVFDYSMIENIFETNPGEAFSYLNAQSILAVLILGVLPAIWLFNVEIIAPSSWYIGLFRRVVLMLIGVVIIVLLALFFYKDYASVGRNNKYLNKMINPAHFYNSVKYLNKRYLSTPLPYKQQGLDATISVANNEKPTLLVLVLGETARSQNMAYNGYPRNTNPYTQDQGIISLQKVASCGTATAHSVPCMFSSLSRSEYNREKANAQDNILDVLSHAKVDITWFENDGGDKGIAKNITKHEISKNKSNPLCDSNSCYDEVLIEQLTAHLKQQIGSLESAPPKHHLITLHTMGSHGPTYWNRYPKDKEVFTPACRRSDIENCNDQEIVNVYDNTLVYTDYILSLVIARLQDYSEQYNVAMLYLSDHGESLGENGLYLHGTPYALAPQEQTQVPWFMWLPKQYLRSTKYRSPMPRRKCQK